MLESATINKIKEHDKKHNKQKNDNNSNTTNANTCLIFKDVFYQQPSLMKYENSDHVDCLPHMFPIFSGSLAISGPAGGQLNSTSAILRPMLVRLAIALTNNTVDYVLFST